MMLHTTLAALLLLAPLLAVHGGFTATFYKPALVGESNYTHFWMPQPLFRVAELEPSPFLVGIALHGDSGPWGACPNPKHPQNCSAMYHGGEDGTGWSPVAKPLNANALVRTKLVSRHSTRPKPSH